MKALALTIYPKLQYPRSGHEIMPYRERKLRENMLRKAKRLTDAELAAEYYKARAAYEKTKFNELSSGDDFTDERWAMVEEPLNIIHRFATLPHYDEESNV
ncbi:hypothetical protein [Arthrobacter sp. GMC3]|uniref:hypothetical protein n=1 Tax=Arthrobacter sp. GMC3 TaxID=2058894 RepID=UPI000CE31AE2|nr:hypothetical protein [Arthrobacter sp. GMC3]